MFVGIQSEVFICNSLTDQIIVNCKFEYPLNLKCFILLFLELDVKETDNVEVVDADQGADNPTSTETPEKPVASNYSAPLPPQRHTHNTDTVISQDNFVFLGNTNLLIIICCISSYLLFK